MIEIRKAAKIEGMGLRLRNAVLADAGFIHSLRTDTKLNKFISAVDGSLGEQIAFLERYEAKQDEAFFVIEGLCGTPFGTIRIYDQKKDSFCWGSWIVIPAAPPRTAIKSALLLYIYAFEYLGFKSAHFDVRQANRGVWRFHESWGAMLTSENSLDRYYTLSFDAWAAVRSRFRAIIEKDGAITVNYLQ